MNIILLSFLISINIFSNDFDCLSKIEGKYSCVEFSSRSERGGATLRYDLEYKIKTNGIVKFVTNGRDFDTNISVFYKDLTVHRGWHDKSTTWTCENETLTVTKSKFIFSDDVFIYNFDGNSVNMLFEKGKFTHKLDCEKI